MAFFIIDEVESKQQGNELEVTVRCKGDFTANFDEMVQSAKSMYPDYSESELAEHILSNYEDGDFMGWSDLYLEEVFYKLIKNEKDLEYGVSIDSSIINWEKLSLSNTMADVEKARASCAEVPYEIRAVIQFRLTSEKELSLETQLSKSIMGIRL